MRSVLSSHMHVQTKRYLDAFRKECVELLTTGLCIAVLREACEATHLSARVNAKLY